jgi:tRNA 2-selenouridine synthase
MEVTPSTELFINDTPLLDVRAPVEFDHGAFPSAVNLPIMFDDEREQVGVCYKEKGSKAAEELGHELVAGNVRDDRISGWIKFLDQHEDAQLYCFRGGQRSKIAESWIEDAGRQVPRIVGGYKALRRLLIDSFDSLPSLVVIGGKTGVGKTEFLLDLKEGQPRTVVDLEDRANHRGSAFGNYLSPQPSPINFENAVAIDFIKCGSLVFLEDEGRMIGKLMLPLPLQDKMKSSPVWLLEDDIDSRVERIYQEYVVAQLAELEKSSGDVNGIAHLRELFLAALDRILKRLGGANHQVVKAQMKEAFDANENGDSSGHHQWIRSLLVNYYDPMYEYQIDRKSDRITERGSADELLTRAKERLENAE